VYGRIAHAFQSAGTFSIPHTLPGSSITRPSRKDVSCLPRLIQLVTLAVTGFETGSPCNRTGVPASAGREIRTVHPFGLTRIIRPDSEEGWSGSRLMTVTGMSQGTRVPECVFTFVEIESLIEISAGVMIPNVYAASRPHIYLFGICNGRPRNVQTEA
jgi:hypothetical protein